MTKTLLRNKCTWTLLSQPFSQFWKAIMQLFLRTVKQVQVKHTLWRGSNIMEATRSAVLCPEAWRKFFSSFKCRLTTKWLLWSELRTSKYIMKSFQTYWKLNALAYKSEKTKKRASSLKDFPNGQSEVQVKFIVWCKEEPCPEQLLQRGWMIFLHEVTLYSLSLLNRWHQFRAELILNLPDTSK